MVCLECCIIIIVVVVVVVKLDYGMFGRWEDGHGIRYQHTIDTL